MLYYSKKGVKLSKGKNGEEKKKVDEIVSVL
jgi:hypothetical protein